MLKLASRDLDAVRELERLQQAERIAAGEPRLSPDDFVRLLHEDVRLGIIRDALDRGGLSAAIAAVDPALPTERDRIAMHLAAWRLDEPGQWSQYETPATRWHLANYCARIEALFNRHNWHIPVAPAVGTLTSGQVSAGTQKTPKGAPLILIDNGFFKFSGMLAQAVLFTSYDANVKGAFSEAALQLVADLAATQTVLNTCLYIYPRTTPSEFMPQVAALQDAVALFVLGHEYGHLAAGDLDAHPLGREVGRESRHAQEFEADKVGFVTALEATDEQGMAGAGVFGAFIYFAGLDLLARAAAVYEDRPPPELAPGEMSGYPTPFERTTHLLDWLEASAYAPQWHEQIRAASKAYNTLLFAWDLILPGFLAARDAMQQFEPGRQGRLLMPDAVVFGLVTTLWQHVSKTLVPH